MTKILGLTLLALFVPGGLIAAYFILKRSNKTADKIIGKISKVTDEIIEELDKTVEEVTEPLNKWQQFTRYCRQNGPTFSRQEMLNEMPCDYKNYKTWDEYRCILERAGYIGQDETKHTKEGDPKRGYFKILKNIPATLTYRQARREAYGK